MISEYFKLMGNDGRLITISKDGDFKSFLTFSVCDDTRTYEDKDLWEYLPHDPYGHICFVEKMLAIKWSKLIRKEIEAAIVEKFPNITEGIWFRPGLINERKVIYRRRHEANL